MSKEIKIGLIGAGWMGKAHTTAFHNARMIFGDDMPVFELVSDVSEGIYKKLKDEGVVFHSEINDCVRDGELVWRWVYSRDPDGICCEIVQLNEDSNYVKSAKAAKD